MGAARIMILGVAAVIAVVLALLVHGLASHKPPPPQIVAAAPPPQPMAQVLVAKRDLAQGARLVQGDIGWQSWPVSSLNPAFVTDGRAPEAAPATPVAAAAKTASHVAAVAASTVSGGPMEARFGAIVRQPILANEPIIDAKLVRGGDGGFMSIVLHQGMRAFAVPITVASAAGGFILPGDRVDVLATHAAEGGRGSIAQILLRNVRVLAIDQGAQPPKGAQAIVGGVATLEIPAQDDEMLAQAKASGEIILALRAYADSAGAVARASLTSGGATGTVRILRNGLPSEVTVTP